MSASRRRPLPLKAIAGVSMSVRGRFRIRKSSIDRIVSIVGDEGMSRHSRSDKRHLYSLSAVSYRRIDESRSMREQIELRHCRGSYFHFHYDESNGTSRSNDKTSFDFDYNTKAKRILDELAYSDAKKLLSIYYYLPPASVPPRSKETYPKFGGLEVSGVTLLVGKRDGEQESLEIDWSDAETLNARVHLNRKVSISKDFSLTLLGQLRDIREPLQNAGLDYDFFKKT